MKKVLTGAVTLGVMADCCSGNRMASATTVRSMAVFSTGTTCTGTPGSFSPESREQLERNNNAATPAQIMPQRQRTKRVARGQRVFADCESVWPIIFLKIPSQRLQIRQRHAKTCLPVIESVARLGQRILRVHHFQDCGLSRLVAHGGQPQTVGGQVGRLVQGLELQARGLRLLVEGAQIAEQLPLREIQLHTRLLAAQACLL